MRESLHTLTLCEVAEGTLISGVHRSLKGGEIDTRRLRTGEAFFCLQGARDGHTFIETALKREAGAIVVRRGWMPPPSLGEIFSQRSTPVIAVDDPQRALAQLAHAHRMVAFHGLLIGLTGSNGKTSTKELLASALSQVGPTLATEGNFNNHLGVPLTLLRLRPIHRFAVVEMGMNAPGEIDHLCQLARPSIGLITTIAAAHLEGLGTVEQVARAKGELFRALPANGHAFFLQDVPHREVALQDVHAQQHPIGAPQWELSDLRHSGAGSAASLHLDEERHTLQIQLSGAHQLRNALLALAVGLHCGGERSALLRGLSICPPPKLRGELRPLAGGGTQWVDCYNANPQSTLASLRTYWERGERGVIVLGAIGELGVASRALHEELGRQVAQLIEGQAMVFTIGGDAEEIHRGLLAEGHPRNRARFYHLDALQQLIDDLRAHSPRSLFLKGSRSGRLERVADALAPPL